MGAPDRIDAPTSGNSLGSGPLAELHGGRTSVHAIIVREGKAAHLLLILRGKAGEHCGVEAIVRKVPAITTRCPVGLCQPCLNVFIVAVLTRLLHIHARNVFVAHFADGLGDIVDLCLDIHHRGIMARP